MARLQHRLSLGVWRMLLALLLLAPLVAQSHAHHGDLAKPASCAVCIAAQHSPAVAGAPACAHPPVLREARFEAVPSVAPGIAAVRLHDGRGPPAPLPTRFA